MRSPDGDEVFYGALYIYLIVAAYGIYTMIRLLIGLLP